MDVGDLIIQETERRAALFETIYAQGPAFTSVNYGTLSFMEDEKFSWTGYELLVPQLIPPAALGSGTVTMGLFLASSLEDRYDGAFSLTFNGMSALGNAAEAGRTVHFMYTLDAQGLRLEYAAPENIEGVTVTRRAASPMVIYFFKAENNVPRAEEWNINPPVLEEFERPPEF
jgi:hypothetical protein